jgi:succinate dehydrogenase / fumarate reductase cytochrome b subunit
MSGLKTALDGYVGYKGREGQISFLLHRITGLGTGLFLTIHILDTATVYFSPPLYIKAIELYRTTPVMLLEIVLVFCVLFHGVNGLRIAYYDLLAPKNWSIPAARSSAIWTLIISIILWLPAMVMMMRSLLIYNYGLFGGAGG